MLKLPEACKTVIQGIDFNALKFGAKQYSPKEKEIIARVLFTEKEIFAIYLKTGKCTLNTFPYNMLKGNYLMKREETQKIAKALIQSGWTPETHVSLTRKKFEKFSYIGKTLTF